MAQWVTRPHADTDTDTHIHSWLTYYYFHLDGIFDEWLISKLHPLTRQCAHMSTQTLSIFAAFAQDSAIATTTHTRAHTRKKYFLTEPLTSNCNSPTGGKKTLSVLLYRFIKWFSLTRRFEMCGGKQKSKSWRDPTTSVWKLSEHFLNDVCVCVCVSVHTSYHSSVVTTSRPPGRRNVSWIPPRGTMSWFHANAQHDPCESKWDHRT